MKKIPIIILLVLPFLINAQPGVVVRNDTIFSFEPTTGVYTQLTKLVPALSGQSGKYLSTDGTSYNWISPVVVSGKLNITDTAGAHDSYRLAIIANTAAIVLKANIASPTFTGTVGGISAAMVGLGNVTNESKATMFTNAAFTGTFAVAAGSIGNAALANSAVANLSGTNTGDNSANSTYASDYRAANFVAGTNYQAPLTIATDATDADFTIAVNSVKYLPSATISQARTITFPAGSNGDYIEIYNNETGFAWNLGGSAIYLSNGSTTVSSLLANTNYIIRKVSGKWRILN